MSVLCSIYRYQSHAFHILLAWLFLHLMHTRISLIYQSTDITSVLREVWRTPRKCAATNEIGLYLFQFKDHRLYSTLYNRRFPKPMRFQLAVISILKKLQWILCITLFHLYISFHLVSTLRVSFITQSKFVHKMIFTGSKLKLS